MKISTKSVISMAVEAGLPDSLIDRHIEALCSLALHLRKRERKDCYHKVRGWVHDTNPAKGPVVDVLED
ncbi:MAG: hypothetical protein LUQ26_01790 [Methylococcaceae bacterium]|nr:hypothetical protein [Methylococcaceae bacterium]